MRPAAIALLLAACLVAAGCGGAGEATTETVTVTETETVTVTETVEAEPAEPAEPGELELTQECANADAGYAVSYPEGWWASPGDDGTPACAFFHPEPLELPEAQDDVLAAVAVSLEPVAFSDATGEDPAVAVVEREDTEISGRPAVRRETEATGEGLFPAGLRGYEYLVHAGDMATLVVSTYDVEGLDFDENRGVVDAMAASLQLSDR